MAHLPFHQVISDIVDTLFEADSRRIASWIDQLVQKNDEIAGKAQHAFIYNGTRYRQSNVRGVIQTHPALDYTLWDEADLLIKDAKQVEQDKSFVRQTLVTLLEPCRTAQEIRNALPECLSECIPSLREYERTAPSLYTIANNPRAKRQIAKIMPKLELYSVARMMF